MFVIAHCNTLGYNIFDLSDERDSDYYYRGQFHVFYTEVSKHDTFEDAEAMLDFYEDEAEAVLAQMDQAEYMAGQYPGE